MANAMRIQRIFLSSLSLLSLLFLLPSSGAAPVGICYGRVANNLPPPSNVVNLLKSNGVSNVRLFNTEPNTLKAFAGSGIQLMIGVPNEILPTLANGTSATSLQWLQSDIFAHVPAAQVRYIAVGNEIFLKDPFYAPFVIPSINNLFKALQSLGLTDTIKLSSPLAASTLSNSYPPSAGAFDPYLRSVMVPLLQFLHDSKSPLMVNAYPFISYAANAQYISLDYALFNANSSANVQDGGLTYTSLFDATIDAFVAAMEKEGFPSIPVALTETGWPTSGGAAASRENALAYNAHVVKRALNDVGTPRRPGVAVEVFLFGVFDENEKGGEEYERHFGIFGLDGAKAYDINFS